jgi:hypothetical protein
MLSGMPQVIGELFDVLTALKTLEKRFCRLRDGGKKRSIDVVHCTYALALLRAIAQHDLMTDRLKQPKK